MSINPKDLLELVCIPACQRLNMLSIDALGLMMGTAAIESAAGTYLIQRTSSGNPVIGGGLGFAQMQQNAHDDCWNIVISHNPHLLNAFNQTVGRKSANWMVADLLYAAMMCRAQYSRFSEKFPAYTDVQGVYNYYKKYWNTGAGASTLDKWMGVYPPVVMLLNQTTLPI